MEEKYDYIIVGAGSSGAVVASRLSEDITISVALLEAGSEADDRLSSTPFLARELQKTEWDYQYWTEPQTNACLKFHQQRSYWPQGKCLGGSSSLNFMVYARGNRRDFDGWAEQEGCTGWSYHHVLPFFIKSQHNLIPEYQLSEYHGHGGEVSTSRPCFSTGLGSVFLEGGRELGYEETDYNGVVQTGFSKAQVTIRNGQRCSTSKAFLSNDVRNRPNLSVLTRAQVLRIDLNDQQTARGVVYLRRTQHGNYEHRIACKKEIIICAGAIGSPKLLMLSGIGDRDHLRQLEIPLVVESSGVGRNLQDHIGVGGMYIQLRDDLTHPLNVASKPEVQLAYNATQNGPLATPVGLEGVAFVNSRFAEPSGDYPDLQFHLSSSITNIPPDVNVKRHLIKGEGLATIMPLLLRPKSRGFVKLLSSDPDDPPIIQPMYLSHPQDSKILAEGVRLAKDLVETKSFRRAGAKLLLAEDTTLTDDSSYERLVRNVTSTIFHPVGTCKMGSSKDHTTVVDTKLRVLGTKGLRVADASVIPTIVSSNTNATCIMIGERCAHFVLSGD